MEHKIAPNVWFDTQAEGAADYYEPLRDEQPRRRGAARSGGRRYDCLGMIEIFPEVSSTAHAMSDSEPI
jgi:hypothetical protein